MISITKRPELKKLIVDGMIALVIYGICTAVVTAYICSLKTSGAGTFYPPSTGPVNESALYYGNLCGLTVAISYGIFRLAAGRAVSALLSALMGLSPFQLYILASSPSRDYARAPYLLALLLILGIVITLKDVDFRVVLLYALAGIIMGQALYVRQEPKLYIIPYAVALIFFLRCGILQKKAVKAAAMVVFLALFYLNAPAKPEPVRSGHTNQGLVTHFNGQNGVTNASYDWGYLILDEHVIANARLQTLPFENLNDSGVAKKIAIKNLLYCPADFIARVYGAILSILDIPYRYALQPQGANGSLVTFIYAVRAFIIDMLSPLSWLIAFTALFIISLQNRKVAAFIILLLIFIGSYAQIQFSGRNYFYLECFSLLFLGIVIRGAGICFRMVREKRKEEMTAAVFAYAKAQGRQVGVFWVAVFLAALLMPISARVYQSGKLSGVFEQYVRAAAYDAGQRRISDSGNDTKIVSKPGNPSIQEEVVKKQYFLPDFMVATFDKAACGRKVVRPVFRYEKKSLMGRDVRVTDNDYWYRADWSRTMEIPLNGRTQVFFPAWPAFLGIELPTEQIACVKDIRRVDITGLPLFLTAVTENGKVNALYQKLEWEEPRVKTSPAGLLNVRYDRDTMNGDVIGEKDLQFKLPSVIVRGNHFKVSGYAVPGKNVNDYPTKDRSLSSLGRVFAADISVNVVDTDLLWFKKRLNKGDIVVARGRLFAGGFMFGLIDSRNNTAGHITVTRTGAYTAAVEVPADDEYIIGFANYLHWYTSLENRFNIDTIEIIREKGKR